MVFPSCMSRHHERYLRLHLRYDLGQDTSHPTIPQKDRRRFYRRMDLYNRHWRGDCLRPNQIQVHDLSRHGMNPSEELLIQGFGGLSMVRFRL
jgi:hypothetical protein